MWQLEEELEDVYREDDYFFRMLHCVVGDESSPRLLRPLRAPQPAGTRMAVARATAVHFL